MKQPIEVVMLPTEDITSLIINNHLATKSNLEYRPDLLEASAIIRSAITYQHLYITVSQNIEPIKGNDWFYNSWTKKVYQAKVDENHEASFKIIATTDHKLLFDTSQVNDISKLQQSFLKEFVANPDVKWEVEYEDKVNPLKLRRTPNGISVAKAVNQALFGLKPKLNKDNTILLTIKTNSRCQIE